MCDNWQHSQASPHQLETWEQDWMKSSQGVERIQVMHMINSLNGKVLGALKIQTNHKTQETCFSLFKPVGWDTEVGDTQLL